MSKRKTDETTTRKPRAKEPDAPASEGNGAEPKADAPSATKAKGRKPKGGAKTQKQEKPSKEELVVFAFRLKPEERDLIHRAAGAAKASRFVRALSVAASRGDEKAVVEIVGAVKAQLAAS